MSGPVDLDQLETALAAVIAPLPWRQDSGYGEDIIAANGDQFGASGEREDAAAIVAAVNAAPALIAGLQDLRAKVAAVEALARQWDIEEDARYSHARIAKSTAARALRDALGSGS